MARPCRTSVDMTSGMRIGRAANSSPALSVQRLYQKTFATTSAGSHDVQDLGPKAPVHVRVGGRPPKGGR